MAFKAYFSRKSIIAMVWGMAEASVFFIVPDVWLSYLALGHTRHALIAAACAVAGALIGGLGMYVYARNNTIDAIDFLDTIPGISGPLITHAGQLFEQDELFGMLRGTFTGIPYKIFCADAGAAGVSIAYFLLASAAARFIRFAATIGVTALLARTLFRKQSAAAKTYIIGAFWVIFYIAYFYRMGW